MIKKDKLKKPDYFSAFSGWIENFGVVPLLLLRAFLLLPIFVFLLALLFLVTLVLETIFQLLSVSNVFLRSLQVALRVTRCPRHNFINLQVLRPSQVVVKGMLLSTALILQTHSVTATDSMQFQELKKELTLAKGELLRLPLPKLVRFSVGNKEVVKARSLKTSALLIKGEKIGHSDVLIWTKGKKEPFKLTVFVVRKTQKLKIIQMAHSLAGLGLDSNYSGQKLRLSGVISSPAIYKDFVGVLNLHKQDVDFEQVSLSSQLRKEIFSNFLIQMAKYSIYEVKCTPLRLAIKCEASEELKEKLNPLSERFFIQWVSQGLLEATTQYKVTLILQQFESSDGSAFNFGLSQIEGSLSSVLFDNPLSLISNNQVLLKDNNFRSQTLAHPTIKTRLNFPVKVRIGQQIPFLQSVTNGVATQQWRFAGLALDLNLKAFSERIKVHYKTNLSRPMGGAISENLQESTLLVPLNQSIVLFDIGFKVNQQDNNQIPGIAKIPLFGSLFQAHSQHQSYKKILCLITIERI